MTFVVLGLGTNTPFCGEECMTLLVKAVSALSQVMSGVDFEDEREELVFSNEEADPEVDNGEFEKLYFERFFKPEDRPALEKLQSEGKI